jgi:hypothetical protein
VFNVFLGETDGRPSNSADGVGCLADLDVLLASEFFWDVLDLLITMVAVEEMLYIQLPLFCLGVDGCGNVFTDCVDIANGGESRDANDVRTFIGFDALLAGREEMCWS